MSSKVPFIPRSDLDDYCKLRGLGFTTIVAVHELIGHGCGKILEETSPGLFNFDRENLPISPLNQEQITTWYKPGETPKSVFGGTYTVLNECLAESIALYLIPNKDLQDLIGVSTIASHETCECHRGDFFKYESG
jgi:dipeptidyl-peptidase-3